jgi:hypothetical protein
MAVRAQALVLLLWIFIQLFTESVVFSLSFADVWFLRLHACSQSAVNDFAPAPTIISVT